MSVSEAPRLHDANVHAYRVDCEGRTVTLHARDVAERAFDIEFVGAVAHKLTTQLEGNILFGIDEVEVGSLVESEAALFDQERRYGWPALGCEVRSNAELVAALVERGTRAFEITPSYGLSGWVLAREMRVGWET